MKMKKIFASFILMTLMVIGMTSLISVEAYAQASNINKEVLAETAKAGGEAALSIMDVGFKTWVKENWMMFIFVLVGAFAVIASITPNSSDNKVADSLWKLVNTLGFNLGSAKNEGSDGKP